jgi:tetratricopeptide (TPR) repeat protein
VALSHISEKINIFFSVASAPQDRGLFDELQKHLSLQRRQGLIEIWYDSAISAGQNFTDMIKAYINKADIIVLLVSVDFLDSEQCFGVEMQYAQEQHMDRAIPIIPVLLRPADLHDSLLEAYSPLPQNGKAITTWENLDTALNEVAQGIRRVVENIASHLTGKRMAARQPQFPLSNLTYRRNLFFTDRDDTLEALHRAFTSGQTRTQALYGPAGIGKTHLAVEYIYRYQPEYQATLWLSATPPELLSANILSLADQLGISGPDNIDEQTRIDAIRRWLHSHDRWLFVLDNLEDFSLVDQLLPLNSGGHVLLITQSQTTGPFTSRLSVDQMSIEDGALLLLRCAQIISKQDVPDITSKQDILDIVSEEDHLQASKIAEELRGYPLALDQAGAYIEETQRPLSAYLELYKKKQAILLGKRGRITNDHPDPVTTTLALTFQKIGEINANALELLHFLAFLHPDVLPDEAIMYGASTLSGTLHRVVSDSLAFDAAIATLRKFSLIRQRTDSTTLNMHHIIQIVLKNDLTKKRQHHLASQAVRLVNFIFPAVTFETWKECERYLPQAVHCATLILDYKLKLKDGGLLLERLGFYYYQRGCYTDAETYLTQAMHLQEDHSLSDSSATAQTLNSLGLLYQQLARYEQAENLYQRSLKLRERLLGPDHPKTAESLHNLAMLYGDQGNYHQAKRLYLQVLALEERTKDSDHPDVASTLNNLAFIFYQQGRYADAKAAYQRALTIYEHALSSNHPNLTYPLDGLATIAEKQGDYQRAEELAQRAVAICKEAFGEDHVETAHSISKLADIAESRGNYQQAEAFYQQALSIYEQALGSQHPDIAPVLNNLAFLAKKRELYEQAASLYERALAIYEQAVGPLHPDVASVLNNLGQLARKMGNVAHAEVLLKRVLDIHEHVFDQPHPDTAQSMTNLADLLANLDKFKEAESFYQQALTIRLQTEDPEHEETTRVREKYATLLKRMNRHEETAALWQATQKPEASPSIEPSQNDYQQ